MKLIFSIALTELRNLFYSPIAWFLTIAFLIQCSLGYTGILYNYASAQEAGGTSLMFVSNLTDGLFTAPNGLFRSAIQNLYLYIPLLTMGLISRELNGGTISLLYSSPVKVSEIVFGKYLAMMIYNLMLLAVVGLFLITGLFNINLPETGLLWSAALGFYLLLCAYAAIGLFMSSLTSYQVVSAIGTFVIIGILTYIGNLWQGIDLIRDFTYFLSLSGRVMPMLSGLITSKDVLYFMVIISMFVSFTIFKLKDGRESNRLSVKLSRYAVIVSLGLVIVYFSSRVALTAYWDVTKNKDNTLTANSQQIIKALGEDPLEITVFDNFLDNFRRLGMPEERNDFLSRWEPYIRFKSNINFHFVYYYDIPYANGFDIRTGYKNKTIKQIVEQQAKASDISPRIFMPPSEIHKIIDLRPEQNRFVMQLKYKGRTTFLRVFNDQSLFPSETEIDAAIARLLQNKMPKIAFASGNGERSLSNKGDRGYNSLLERRVFRYALINQGFDVCNVKLGAEPLPEGITALVVADPLTPLNISAIKQLQEFINKGGNVLIAGEPGRGGFCNPLLKQLGVQLMDGMLKQGNEDNGPALLLPEMTKGAKELSKSLTLPGIDTFRVSMNGAAGLKYADTSGFKIFPLLKTSLNKVTSSSARNPDMDLVDIDQTNQADHKTRNADRTTTHLPVYTTALALTRQVNGREQRIVIAGDADFMGNAELARESPQVLNFYFATSIFSWMDYGRFPINTSRPKRADNRVNVSTSDVSVMKIVYVWILPGLLLIFASGLLIRRARK